MEAQQPVRTELGNKTGSEAPSSVVHLHGVPVPSRVFGFSAGWYRPEEIRLEASTARFTLLLSDAEKCAPAMSGVRELQEVAAA